MNSEMLKTGGAHGMLTALHEGGRRRAEGWIAQDLKHLGGDGCIAPTTWHGHEKWIPADPSSTDCEKNDPGPLSTATINVLAANNSFSEQRTRAMVLPSFWAHAGSTSAWMESGDPAPR
jgi:hypothetical protein